MSYASPNSQQDPSEYPTERDYLVGIFVGGFEGKYSEGPSRSSQVFSAWAADVAPHSLRAHFCSYSLLILFHHITLSNNRFHGSPQTHYQGRHLHMI